MPSYRIGIDIGGTFTDFVLVREDSGAMRFAKALTTPRDPSECVLAGVHDLLAEHRVTIDQVQSIVHGTTLATNAVIERRGATTGLLTTKGFGYSTSGARPATTSSTCARCTRRRWCPAASGAS